VIAQGTYNELLKSHLAALTTMNSDAEANTIEEVEDQIHADENEKEARAISNEMKAREEVDHIKNTAIAFLYVFAKTSSFSCRS
jgi:hypothetical protein